MRSWQWGAAVGMWTVALLLSGWAVPGDPGAAQPTLRLGPVPQAIFNAARFVLPIVGAVQVIRVLLYVVMAVGAGFSGKEAVRSRLLNLGVALLLIAIPLTGVWVPLANAILAVVEQVLRPLERATQ